MEYVILGLAARKPIYGYELLQEWREKHQLDRVWRIKPGALYAALEKLEQMGLLSSVMVPNPASPPRKEYCITPAGAEAFREWVSLPVSSARQIRQEFMSKLFFADDLGEVRLAELIRGQTQASQRWLETLREQEGKGDAFSERLLQFRIRQVRGILEWLNQLQSG
jgi:DNA-binding PadR family transcriptional regulator